MLGEATLVFGTHTSFYATHDFLAMGHKFFQVFNFSEVWMSVVLAEKTFHRFLNKNGK